MRQVIAMFFGMPAPLNWAVGRTEGRFLSRVESSPLMEVLPREYDELEKPVTYEDTHDTGTGWIVKRSQSFAMPTIERGRLIGSQLDDRLPPIDSAFFVADGSESPLRPEPPSGSKSGPVARRFPV